MDRDSTTRPVDAHPNESGVTFIELAIATTLVVVLAYLVFSLSRSGLHAQEYAQRMNRVTEISQELTEAMREELQSSIRLLGSDATGNAYLGLLDFTGMPAPIDSTRLPEIDDGGVFEPDGALDHRTGNGLCFARHAWSDEFAVSSGRVHRIDVYRFVYFYMASAGNGPSPSSPSGLNLVQWVSEPLASGSQIDAIDAPAERVEVCEHLRVGSPDSFGDARARVQVAWRVGGDPAAAGTLRQITTGGVLVDAQTAPRPSGSWRLYGDPLRSRPELLSYRNHSIATNHAPRICGVGRFGYAGTTGAGFPHGFEVQVIGPSSARQVLVHTSIVSTRPGRLAFFDSQVITDARDL